MTAAGQICRTVAVVGHFHSDSFAENIYLSLTEMGHRSVAIETRRAPGKGVSRSLAILKPLRMGEDLALRSRCVRALADHRVESQLEAAEPDLVISTNGYLYPDQLERWRSRTPAARWALWYPDHLANLGAQRCLEAPWDTLFFKDPYLVERLSAFTTLRVHVLPEACLPSRHRTYEHVSREERTRYACDVALGGNLYPYRVRVLETLPPLSLKLYGNPPGYLAPERIRRAYTGEYVTGRAKFLAYTQASIVLNTLHYAEVDSANARLFEAAGCGAFIISHRTPGVTAAFSAGEELVAVDSAEEMNEAIVQYLKSPQDRRAMAAAAQHRAHTEHTYERRLRTLMELTAA